MAQESQLAHRVLTSLALPYQTNVSPTMTDPHFISGSTDILTSINGYAERRPGFSTNVETTPTTFNNLQRLFTWDRFDGTFYIMACDVNSSGVAQVFKYQVGVDTSFVSVYIDDKSTVFDFVTSNNTLYFSNGNTAWKWDPSNGLSIWGISIGSISNIAGPNIAGTGSQAGSGALWTNATNVTSNASFATITIPSTLQSVSSVTVNASGSGYVFSSAFPVNFTGGGGTGAAATAFTLKDHVRSVTVNAGGSGYTSAPGVDLSGGGGTGATGTAIMSGSGMSNQAAESLIGTNFSLGLTSVNTVKGIAVQFAAIVTASGTGGGTLTTPVQLVLNGAPLGTPKLVTLILDGASHTYALGNSGDLWGTSLSGASAGNSTFGFQITPALTGLTGSYALAFQVNNYQITASFLGGPAIAVSASAGTMSATVGYQYEFCYGNSNSGHVSSPTPPSLTTGIFSNKLNVAVTLTPSTDPQVNQIRLFRTTDSASGIGGQAYFEVPTSPYPNIGWTFTSVANHSGSTTVYTGTFTGASGFASSIGQSFIVSGFVASAGVNNGTFVASAATATTLTLSNASGVAETHAGAGLLTALDAASDIQLNIFSIAPVPTFNDPPTPMVGLAYFSGRIWGFTGNTVYFTGLEEITIGVPEESMPSGIAGNSWTFDEPVQALGVGGIGNNQGLAILCGGRLYGIQGNTLDTFVRFSISNRRGARNRTCISALGGMLAWLDSANQVWATDGTNVNELSTLIRNDLTGIAQANCSVTFHSAGRFHWLVLSTGTKLYVYDIDQDQWMPPWTFAAKYIYSGEISPGNYVLMASNGTKALQLNLAGTAGSFNDNGATYQPILKFGLLSVVPDYGSRFSYIGVGSYNEPTRTGYPSTFQLTNNGQAISDFLICQDDDPTLATYTSIAGGLVGTEVAFNRNNGLNMKQLVYQTLQPAARWIGMQVKLANADQADNLYELFMAYKGLGGR